MTDTGPGAVKGHPPPPYLNPFSTSVSLPLQAPPPWLSIPSQMGGDEIPGALTGSHTTLEGLRAGPSGGCVTAAGSLHPPHLHSLSSKMRVLTPSPFPGRLDHWNRDAEVESHRRHRASSFCTPLLPLHQPQYIRGLPLSPRGRPSPTTSESTGPFLTCWKGGVGSPQVDPSPTPHQQSPSEVAKTPLLAPQLFLEC